MDAAVTICVVAEPVPAWLVEPAVPLVAAVPEAEQPARVRTRANAATEKVLLNLRMGYSFVRVCGVLGVGCLMWRGFAAAPSNRRAPLRPRGSAAWCAGVSGSSGWPAAAG